ncbi:MAG: hypothetical protein IH895_02985, partial [Planctomycetes bacterium]|nr:hypothetical protein [Planctomycetota bacterium]
MLAILAQATDSGYLGLDQQSGPSSYWIIGGFVALLALMIGVRVVVEKRGAKRRGAGRNGRSAARKRKAQVKNTLAEFAVPYLDMDQLINPPTGRPRPIPEELRLGTVLMSQRLGVKCLLLDSLEEVDRKTLKDICARKLRPNQALYLPMGTQVYKDEILPQG